MSANRPVGATTRRRSPSSITRSSRPSRSTSPRRTRVALAPKRPPEIEAAEGPPRDLARRNDHPSDVELAAVVAEVARHACPDILGERADVGLGPDHGHDVARFERDVGGRDVDLVAAGVVPELEPAAVTLELAEPWQPVLADPHRPRHQPRRA